MTLFKAMRDAIDQVKMSVPCGLGDLQFTCTAAFGCTGFVSLRDNLASELPLELLESADACNLHQVREIYAKTGWLHEFDGTRTRNRVSNPRGLTASKSYVADPQGKPGYAGACRRAYPRA